MADTVIEIAAGQSLDALRELVSKKISDAYPSPDPNTPWGCWVRELFPNYAIADVGGKLYKVDFALNGTDVTLGDKTEVVTTYKAAEAAVKSLPVAESSVEPLVASRISKNGNVWDMQVLASGRTLTANKDLGAFDPQLRGIQAFRNYTAESVRDAVSRNVFNAIPFVIRNKDEHLGTANNYGALKMMRANEPYERIAGMTSGNYVAETADGGVAVRVKLTLNSSELGQRVREDLLRMEAERDAAAESADTPLVDVSWTGDAESILATSPFIPEPIIDVPRINYATTVDPCLVGNAKGGILKAAEAALKQKPKAQKPMKQTMKKTTAKNKAAEAEADATDTTSSTPSTALDFMIQDIWNNFPGIQKLMTLDELSAKDEADIVALYAELDKEEDEKAEEAEDATPDTPVSPDTNKAAEAAIGKLTNLVRGLGEKLEASEKKTAEAEAKQAVAESVAKVASAKLPASLEKMLTTQIESGMIGDLDKVILDAKNAAAEMGILPGSGFRVTDDGSSASEEGFLHMLFANATPNEKKLCAEMFGKDYSDRKYRTFSGPREWYLTSVGGREVGRGFGQGARGAVAESAAAGQITQVAGDAMHRRMLVAYRAAEQWNDFEKVIKWVPVNDFKVLHAQNFGYFNNPLTPIVKGNDYPQIPISGTQDVLLTLVEQGGLFSIDWQDIVNDNVGFFQNVPQRMGIGSKQQLYKAVFDRIALGTSTQWQSSGNNELSTALGSLTAAAAISDTQIVAMNVLMSQQTDLASQVIGLTPKYLIYPQTQLGNAYKILLPGAGQLTAGNSIGINGAIVATASQSLGLEGIKVLHWDNTKNFYALAADPLLAEGLNVLCYQGNQEPQIVQEMAETGLNFTAKKIQYRLEHHWKVGMVDYRPFVGAAMS